MPRLLHTADWQIGKPYRWITDPERRSRLQRTRLVAIEHIIEQAANHAADVVMVAGDLFDSSTVDGALVMEVLELIGSISTPVLVIPGNHDHGGAGGVWRRDDVQAEMQQRAANLHLLLEPVPLEIAGFTVLPCPLRRQHESVSPGVWIETLDWSQLDPDLARIVLAHGSIQGFQATDYASIHNEEDVAQADSKRPQAVNQLNPSRWNVDAYDYLALGDWHALKAVGPKGWYCGTPEPDRFPTSSDDQRSQVLIADVERGQSPDVRPVYTAGMQWHSERISLRSGKDLERVKQRIRALTGSRVGRDLLRLELDGQLGLEDHHELQLWLDRLHTRLLHLRIRGHCHRRPEASELSELLDRSNAPLMRSIAHTLQTKLEQTDPTDAEQISLLETSLCELHRLYQAAEAEEALEVAA